MPCTTPTCSSPARIPRNCGAYFVARLADPTCTAFLTGTPPAGYTLCALQRREGSLFSPPVRHLLIDHIAVVSDACRQSHGSALLRAARELAGEVEIDEILLDTWEANRYAHAFFQAEGFSVRRMLFRATPRACAATLRNGYRARISDKTDGE